MRIEKDIHVERVALDMRDALVAEVSHGPVSTRCDMDLDGSFRTVTDEDGLKVGFTDGGSEIEVIVKHPSGDLTNLLANFFGRNVDLKIEITAEEEK